VRLTEYHELFAFNRWANHRVHEMVSGLTDEELRRDLKNSFPSVLDTLVHSLSAEWVWMERLKGDSPAAMPAEFRTYGVPQLTERWRRLEAEQQAYVTKLTKSELARVVAYRNMKGEPRDYPLWQILRHVVNHATYHRGQIAGMVRQMGKVPLATDMVVFYDQQRSR